MPRNSNKENMYSYECSLIIDELQNIFLDNHLNALDTPYTLAKALRAYSYIGFRYSYIYTGFVAHKPITQGIS